MTTKLRRSSSNVVLLRNGIMGSELSCVARESAILAALSLVTEKYLARDAAPVYSHCHIVHLWQSLSQLS